MLRRITKNTMKLLTLGLLLPGAVMAEESAPPAVNDMDTMWVLLAAFLVFFMQPGFAMVETGLTRAKNAVNILAKNFMDFALASILFFLVGYGFMFGEGNSFIGLSGFALEGMSDGNLPLLASWFFQAVFCGTAATIVSGGMAERTKFTSYILSTAVITTLVYPIIGHWTWGGGWLSQMGFFDFAGSTIVHSTGGWIALVGTMFLGPRYGKYTADGKSRVLAGHSVPLAALGVFILWFGWFGFNPGSQLAASGASNAGAISLITVNTNLSAAAGALAAMCTVWMMYGKPDLTMCMNGALAGLVAITAPCAVVSPGASIVIGILAGMLVVMGVMLLDKLHIDDPVGAIPVHAFNGAFGTLAVGVWGQKALGLANDGLLHGGGFTQLGVQATGVIAVGAFAMISMAIVFAIIKSTVGLRVSLEEELRGLDIEEHGMEAYSDFQIFTTR
ncbi:ammonium transporter [Desulfarculus baarsii DSM 2075]|uniref:Ammonium transporter n=1 Tax=Desulfarculus baarsii (strain ATCC 33931 / DSM 2075 / LMG 7858 / VKM B-1802 / 2st14) TaxID=644282 RepID=E1QIU3_DESB2|nr:ammonium transporter [Desulfarculus baarsii]ADK84516.1 ammonium transporter [Desulfarculus baarsii DSM 2075]